MNIDYGVKNNTPSVDKELSLRASVGGSPSGPTTMLWQGADSSCNPKVCVSPQATSLQRSDIACSSGGMLRERELVASLHTFLVLNPCLDVIDGIRGLDLQSDGLASDSLDEDLHGAGKITWQLNIDGEGKE